MLYSDVIVKAIFTDNEIKDLENIYNYEKDLYLDSLNNDPFTDDQTEDTIKTVIQPMLKAKNIDIQNCELNELTKHLTYFFI